MRSLCATASPALGIRRPTRHHAPILRSRVQIAQHPGTALLLCHNVTKAFARGGDAIPWHAINRATGEYSDGHSTYVATGTAAAFAGPSIFPALFATGLPGAPEAGSWY